MQKQNNMWHKSKKSAKNCRWGKSAMNWAEARSKHVMSKSGGVRQIQDISPRKALYHVIKCTFIFKELSPSTTSTLSIGHLVHLQFIIVSVPTSPRNIIRTKDLFLTLLDNSLFLNKYCLHFFNNIYYILKKNISMTKWSIEFT